MKLVGFVLVMFLGQCLFGQVVADFENQDIGLDSALVQGSDVDGFSGDGFTSGEMFFPNCYNAEFDFFTKWAISSMRDTVTAGPGNSTSSYAGGGQESDAYAVASAFSPVVVEFSEASTGVEGVYVTNNTYSALSMKNGDMFAKRFGGETGDDPDFFKLTIKAWLGGELSADSVDFYLADYRFQDNTQDYIVKDWAWVSLADLGGADSLQFSLSSSDVGAFGMNTPAFFCVDNIELQFQSSVWDGQERNIDPKIYPNPVSEVLVVENPGPTMVIYDSSGRQVKHVEDGTGRIAVSDLLPGVYTLRTDGGVGRFIKR